MLTSFMTTKFAQGLIAPSTVVLGILFTGCSGISKNDNIVNSTAQALEPDHPVVALVLGGGGAKGLAHVGVIKVLEANGINPDLVVGTSVGSFVGSIYASGQSAADLERLALTTQDSELTDFTLAHQGIIEGQKLRQFVNTQVKNKPIEAFPIRFAAVAAEKNTLKKAVFDQGDAGLMVQASSSVPNVFIAPRVVDPNSTNKVGHKYVDGGVVSMVPVDAAKQLGADVVIAVDLQVDSDSIKNLENSSTTENTTVQTRPLTLNSALFNITELLNTSHLPKRTSLNATDLNSENIWEIVDQGYAKYSTARSANAQNPAVQRRQAAKQAEIKRADVIIRPDVSDISAINTSKREEAIAAGVYAAQQSLPAIKAAIKKAESNYQATIH